MMLNLEDRFEFPDKSNDILTIGELLIDMISAEYDDSFECKTYHKYFGGSPANIAMNAKKLGIRSIVAAAVGNDGLGDSLIRQLHNAEIETTCIQQVDYSTSMVVVTKSIARPIPIFYRGADCYLSYTAELDEALKSSKIVHFSCWPMSMEPARQTIEKVIHEARKQKILICFDPNYHPMIWQKGESGADYVKSIIGKTDIVKPSEDDAERIFGADGHENQIHKFLELGAKLVILTTGKDGAIISNGRESVKMSTFATKVVDTTGAGDAFWSGFYTALVQGSTIREALISGFVVSAYKLGYTGAIVDLPKLEAIKDIYAV